MFDFDVDQLLIRHYALCWVVINVMASRRGQWTLTHGVGIQFVAFSYVRTENIINSKFIRIMM